MYQIHNTFGKYFFRLIFQFIFKLLLYNYRTVNM